MRPIDLTGMKFGRLTVVSRAENSKGGKTRWLCKCECGKECVVYACSLRSGNTKSCGCLRREASHEKATTHGLSKTSLFHVWNAMKNRCKNPNNRSYKNYGGRGIDVCDEWLVFASFADWAFGNGYREGLTLERIDVDGGYNPGNCKWIPPEKQAHNKRNNFFVELDGEQKRLVQLCEEYQIDYLTVYQRINKLGWDTKRALTTPPRKVRKRK